MVLVSEEVYDLFLVFFVLDEHFRDGLREKYFAVAALCFCALEDADSFTELAFGRENLNDVFSVKLFECFQRDPLVLLVDGHGRTAVFHGLRGDVHAVPGQASHFSDPQGCREGEVHGEAEDIIVAEFCRLHQSLCRPDLSCFRLIFRDGRIYAGVLFHQFPFNSLFKAAAEEFVDIPDCAQCDCFVFVSFGTGGFDGRSLQELLIEYFYESGIDVRDFGASNHRLYIIPEQTVVPLISGGGPFVFSIQLDIFVEEFLQAFALRNDEVPDAHLVFNFFFSLQGFCLILNRFPFLFLLSLLIPVAVNNTVFVSALSDRCHVNNASFILWFYDSLT